METATWVIQKLPSNDLIKTKPVIRHGEPVKFLAMEDEKQMMLDMATKINKLRNGNFKSMAVICKTEAECIEIQRFLKKQGLNVPVINGKE